MPSTRPCRLISSLPSKDVDWNAAFIIKVCFVLQPLPVPVYANMARVSRAKLRYSSSRRKATAQTPPGGLGIKQLTCKRRQEKRQHKITGIHSTLFAFTILSEFRNQQRMLLAVRSRSSTMGATLLLFHRCGLWRKRKEKKTQ